MDFLFYKVNKKGLAGSFGRARIKKIAPGFLYARSSHIKIRAAQFFLLTFSMAAPLAPPTHPPTHPREEEWGTNVLFFEGNENFIKRADGALYKNFIAQEKR